MCKNASNLVNNNNKELIITNRATFIESILFYLKNSKIQSNFIFTTLIYVIEEFVNIYKIEKFSDCKQAQKQQSFFSILYNLIYY